MHTLHHISARRIMAKRLTTKAKLWDYLCFCFCLGELACCETFHLPDLTRTVNLHLK